MKMSIDKYLDIFYSLLMDSEIDSIEFRDMVEIIKILYSSEDFEFIASQINIDDFNGDVVLNHDKTIDIDDNDIVTFDVSEEERKKIIEENNVTAGYIQLAINKRGMVKYMREHTNGVVNFKYDGPNGVYNLPYVNSTDDRCYSGIYTDGVYTRNIISTDPEEETATRTVKIEKATYSIMVTVLNGYIDSFDVRALFTADYGFVFEEVKRILAGRTESYKEEFSEQPKAYKFKIH